VGVQWIAQVCPVLMAMMTHKRSSKTAAIRSFCAARGASTVARGPFRFERKRTTMRRLLHESCASSSPPLCNLRALLLPPRRRSRRPPRRRWTWRRNAELLSARIDSLELFELQSAWV
jgi:hypothetical protein